MKILFFADVEPTGGTGTFFFRMLDFLSENNRITVVLDSGSYFKKGLKEKLALYPNLKVLFSNPDYKIEKLATRYLNHLKINNIYHYIREYIFLKIINYIKKPDLILFSQGSGTVKWFSFLKLRTPSLFFIHTVFSKVENIIRFSIKKTNILSNKKIINVSDFAKNHFLEYLNIKKINNISITIPNYANIQNLSNKKNNKKEINILTIGHVIEYKNPNLWFEIAQELIKKYSNVNFLWIGNGSEYEKYKKKTINNKRIIFGGFSNNVSNFYSIADIYFQPSKIESQGIAVIEAMANKLPCVVSKVGGLPESVINNKSGYICDLNNKEDFIDKLSILIESKDEREKKGIEGFSLFQEKFSKIKWENQVLKTINDVLNIRKK